MKIPGSFPSALPHIHPIWAYISCPVSSGGAPPPPNTRSNFTSGTVPLLLTVDGGNSNLVHKIQATFAGLYKTVNDPYIAAYFYKIISIHLLLINTMLQMLRILVRLLRLVLTLSRVHGLIHCQLTFRESPLY